MKTYPRRDPTITNCTDPFIVNLIKTGESPCDVSGGPCLWEGNFEVQLYNTNLDFATFDWDTTLGVIVDDSLETITLQVTSDVPETLDLTLTMTYDDSVNPIYVTTMTVEVVTSTL